MLVYNRKGKKFEVDTLDGFEDLEVFTQEMVLDAINDNFEEMRVFSSLEELLEYYPMSPVDAAKAVMRGGLTNWDKDVYTLEQYNHIKGYTWAEYWEEVEKYYLDDIIKYYEEMM